MNRDSFLVLLLIFSIFYIIKLYNRLVSLRQSTEAAWSDIDVQLKRRSNLIPALVEVVKAYKKYEAETFETIVKARQMEISARSVKEYVEADTILAKALSRIFALAEAYPELKANKNFLELQNQLGQVEDAIQNARRYYNAMVRDYNTRLESLPDIFIALIFGFRPKDFFELDPEEETA